jgi:hypothetical protein
MHWSPRSRKQRLARLDRLHAELRDLVDYLGEDDHRSLERMVRRAGRKRYNALNPLPPDWFERHVRGELRRESMTKLRQRATKLRAMTVKNGCTVAEAAAAKEKLQRFKERGV